VASHETQVWHWQCGGLIPTADGKIKAGVPRVAKPLTWLSFLRAVGRAVVPRAGKRLAFSSLFSALAIQSGPEGAHEQRR
jgi:hypothetical protein